MSEEELDSMIQMCCAVPCDSTSRGALADALDERGDECCAAALRGQSGETHIREVWRRADALKIRPSYKLLWAVIVLPHSPSGVAGARGGDGRAPQGGRVMNERAAFIRVICEQPEDDTARLVFADWLQENGEAARAEFIRVQCELTAKGNTYNPKCTREEGKHYVQCGHGDIEVVACAECWKAEGARMRDLLESYRADWLADAPCKMDAWSLDEPILPYNYGMRVRFRRGFVEEVVSTAADFLKHARDLFAAHPVVEVRLTDRVPETRHSSFGWGSGFATAGNDYARCSDVPWIVPGELYDLMMPDLAWEQLRNPPTRCWRYYPTDADAHAALSCACIRYGRRLVFGS